MIRLLIVPLFVFLLWPALLQAEEKTGGYFRKAKPPGIFERMKESLKEPFIKKKKIQHPYIRQID
ncbi:MAG TPA: hypothetical protein PLY88_02870 [Candidatus Omnitrophota bacterium]|nr:hypothetical protein [Candidatus Omnitrophota bacterium]